MYGYDILIEDNLKPWLIEVNHTPSFAAETGVDEDIKKELITHALEIVKLSVDNRKRIDKEIKLEMREQIQQNCYKRPTAKEHSDRVRFDPI